MHSPEQDLIAEWFVQKGHRASAQRPRLRLLILMGRDEDEWYGAMGHGQLLLEFEAAHPRHPHVDDQTCRSRQMPGLQQILCRGAHFSPETNRSKETLEGFAHGLIIIDNGDHGVLGHTRLSWLRKLLPGCLGYHLQPFYHAT
jgi:hypothetical protein